MEGGPERTKGPKYPKRPWKAWKAWKIHKGNGAEGTGEIGEVEKARRDSARQKSTPAADVAAGVFRIVSVSGSRYFWKMVLTMMFVAP